MDGGLTGILSQLGAWNWLILAGLFFILELLAPGIFLVWFGIAATAVGLLALIFNMSWQWQLVLFAVFSISAAIMARRFLRSSEGLSGQPLLHRRAEQHVGKSYVLAEAIENGRGKVKIGDTFWRVEGPDLAEGRRVRVTGTDGAVLLVEPDTN